MTAKLGASADELAAAKERAYSMPLEQINLADDELFRSDTNTT